jgi:hypothetical protein
MNGNPAAESGNIAMLTLSPPIFQVQQNSVANVNVFNGYRATYLWDL